MEEGMSFSTFKQVHLLKRDL